MTREEAIRELNTFKIGAKSELGETALDMAIKALDQESCEDAISRQSMLDYLKYLHGEMPEEEFVKALPSVTPAICIAKVNFSKEDMQEIVDKKVKEMIVRKKGKWVNKSHTSDCGIKFVASECTCCHKKTFFDCDQLVYRYCPNCGAEMEGLRANEID